jgi:hypothetical protein
LTPALERSLARLLTVTSFSSLWSVVAVVGRRFGYGTWVPDGNFSSPGLGEKAARSSRGIGERGAREDAP